jgi:hypothetical protein
MGTNVATPEPLAAPGRNSLDKITSLLASSAGSVGSLAVAITLAGTQFKTLSEFPKTVWKKAPDWLGGSVVVAVLLLLTFATVWGWLEKRRLKRYAEIGGTLKRGYFNLQPREMEEGFDRADNAHVETLRWVQASKSPVLYLTGASGTGKSSVVAAWVVPKLKAGGHIVIRLRGYEALLARIQEEILKPGVVWDRGSHGAGDLTALLTRARKNLAPHRIFFVVDQFEEFLILKSEEEQQALRQFLKSIINNSLDGVTFLFVFRSEYAGMIDSKGWPERLLRVNLREIFSFDEGAAQDFMNRSQKTLDPGLLRTVLREASEIELGAAGMIRPITLNLCGLVLGRFANGLPSKFRGRLIRGFLRESISLPETRETATKIIPKLITHDVTKRPRTIDELVRETGLSHKTVRACLYRLGSEDRGIVRALDNETQKTWEISHDFLVPLLDATVVRWTASLWRRSRPWLSWIVTVAFALTIPIVLGLRDPLREMADSGWTVHREGTKWTVSFERGVQTEEARLALGRIPATELLVRGSSVEDVSALKDLDRLTSLTLDHTRVSDVSVLKNLKSLTSLTLSYDYVRDLSALKDLDRLTSLTLEYIPLNNLSALKDLKSLTYLTLNDIFLSDVSALKDLKSLTYLDLRGTKVSDVAALKDLESLKYLNLSETQVSDVSALEDLESLISLDLRESKVSDVSALKYLGGLKILR